MSSPDSVGPNPMIAMAVSASPPNPKAKSLFSLSKMYDIVSSAIETPKPIKYGSGPVPTPDLAA